MLVTQSGDEEMKIIIIIMIIRSHRIDTATYYVSQSLRVHYAAIIKYLIRRFFPSDVRLARRWTRYMIFLPSHRGTGKQSHNG